jgi:hypothetical protein
MQRATNTATVSAKKVLRWAHHAAYWELAQIAPVVLQEIEGPHAEAAVVSVEMQPVKIWPLCSVARHDKWTTQVMASCRGSFISPHTISYCLSPELFVKWYTALRRNLCEVSLASVASN